MIRGAATAEAEFDEFADFPDANAVDEFAEFPDAPTADAELIGGNFGLPAQQLVNGRVAPVLRAQPVTPWQYDSQQNLLAPAPAVPATPAPAAYEIPELQQAAEQQEIERNVAVPEALRPLGDALTRGLAQSRQAAAVKTGNVEAIAAAQREIAARPQSQALQQFNRSKTAGEMFEALASDPLTVFTELTAESAAAYLPTWGKKLPVSVGAGAAMGAAAGAPFAGIGALPGAAIGAKAGVIGSSAMASYELEAAGKILETLTEAGVDVTNADSLREAFGNEELMSKARSAALRKGVPIAILDGVSAGIAGRLIGKPGLTIGRKMLAGGREFGEQAALGMGGEAAGQVAAGEELNLPAIAAEGLAEGPTAAVEIGAGALRQRFAENAPRIASDGIAPPETERAPVDAAPEPPAARSDGLSREMARFAGVPETPQPERTAPAGEVDEFADFPDADEVEPEILRQASPEFERELEAESGIDVADIDAEIARRRNERAAATEQPQPPPSATGRQSLSRERLSRPEPIYSAAAEQAARAEYERELTEQAQAYERGQGDELLNAIEKSGGLPIPGSEMSGPYRGELRGVLEMAKGGRHVGAKGVFTGKLFRQDAPDVDTLAVSLRDRGFDVATPNDVFVLLDQRLRTGRAVYGVPQRAAATVPESDLPFKRTEQDPRQGVLPFDEREGSDLRGQDAAADESAPTEAAQSGLSDYETRGIERDRYIKGNQRALAAAIRRRLPQASNATVRRDLERYAADVELGRFAPNAPQTRYGLSRDSEAHRLAVEAQDELGLANEDIYFRSQPPSRSAADDGGEIDRRTGRPYSLPSEVRRGAVPSTSLDDRAKIAALARAVEKDPTRRATRRDQPRLEPVRFPAHLATNPQVQGSEAIARLHGHRPIWFRNVSGEAFNGAIFGDTIFLNVDSVDDAVHGTTAHEITHAMERKAPDIYRELEAVLMREARGRRRDYLDNRLAIGYPRKELRRELVADFVGELFGENPAQAAAILRDNPTLWQRIVEFINDFIDSLKRRLVPPDDSPFATPNALDTVERLDVAQRAVRNAFRQYRQRLREDDGATVDDGSTEPLLARSRDANPNVAAYRALAAKRDDGTITPGESQRLEAIERELGQNFLLLEQTEPKTDPGVSKVAGAAPQFRGAETAEDVDDGFAFGAWEDRTGQQAFFKRQQLSPEENVFRGPIIEGRWRRFFYEGARDVFDRTLGLKFLGAAIRKHVDLARKYTGEMSYPYRRWHQKYGRAERRQALSDFQSYWGEHAKNPENADRFLSSYSPASKELIQLWRGTARYAAERNQGMSVWDDQLGAYRPIGTIKDYFPRSVRPEVWEMVEQGIKDRKEWERMVAALKAEGMIRSENEAISYLEKALKPVRRFDYLGNIEHARNLPLPNRAYDYSFNAARRYIAAWAERRAQVEAFGQKIGVNGKDLFDLAREKTYDRATREYIELVQRRAYNEVPNGGIQRTAAFLNTLATPLHLANPKTLQRNLISGLVYNQTTFGVRHALRAAFEMRRSWKAIDDAYEKGVLSEDLMNMMSDAEQLQSKPLAKLQRGTDRVFRITGYRLSEDFVRAHALLTAKAFLRAAIKAFNADPQSRSAVRYAAFLKRNGHNISKLAGENGDGELTRRYLRESVNLAQGGYRYDQVPMFTDSPVGRFLFKYQKWGTQATRNFVRNVLAPAAIGTELTYVRDGKRVTVKTREFQPLTRYMIATILAGQAILGLEELMFGAAPGFASIDEILKTWEADKKRALEITLGRMWKGMIAVGGLGIIANYSQHLLDFTERRGSSNPMTPPALGTVFGLLHTGLAFVEQGYQLTLRDLEDLLNSQVSLYRTTKDAAARVAQATGSTAEWSREEGATHDLRWLNTVTRRYADEIGEPAKRTAPGRMAKAPRTPFDENLRDALMIGDVGGVRDLLREQMAGLNSAQREAFLKSVKASVRARQPIRVGMAGAERRALFLDWAKKRLPADELARVRRIDSAYLKTARAAGLMSEPEPVNLDEALRKHRMRRELRELSGR